MGQSKRRIGERPAPAHLGVGRNRRSRSGQASAPLVVVTSELALVAETVTAALVTRGLVASYVPWSILSAAPSAGGRARKEAPQAVAADVVLVIQDIGSASVLRAVRLWSRACECPWVVMSDAPRGPAWGGALEVGARAVVGSTISLTDLVAVLEMVARGETLVSPWERSALVSEWRRSDDQRKALSARLRSLSPRERQVLTMLYEGTTVKEIAGRVGVSETTVRSQVRGVLRKLAVDSQLAAVAVLSEVEGERTDGS